MKEYKNIEKLFQEKLNELDAQPTSDLWNTIEEKLKRKERRVFPYWWLSGGVAALLILSLFLYPFSDGELVNDATDTPINVTIAPKKDNSNKQFLNKRPNKTEVIVTAIDSVKILKLNLGIKSKSKKLISKKLIIISDKKEEIIVRKQNAKKTKKKESFIAQVTLDSLLKKESTKKVKLKSDFTKAITKKKDIKKSADKKWFITPTFAVLSSNSYSGSSPLSENLSSSPIIGETNFSYGVNITYSINSKWFIQSGVHIQKLSYSNNNLSIISLSTNTPLSGVNYINNTVAFSISTLDYAHNAIDSNVANLISHSTTLTQTYGYIEIPIEVKYVILKKKKINSKIIAGFSSLFLNKNEVFVSSPIISKKLGKANNLNTINFSGNLGFDIDFNLNKRLNLNINPMLKTQFNTFSERTNGFKPYLIALYTGVKYQF